jgi:hypothetical protein
MSCRNCEFEAGYSPIAPSTHWDGPSADPTTAGTKVAGVADNGVGN